MCGVMNKHGGTDFSSVSSEDTFMDVRRLFRRLREANQAHLEFISGVSAEPEPHSDDGSFRVNV